ncbi:Eco57I restriction-modification methylase domain-containing protein [Fibrobacter sp. UBA4297]|uniref:Eco57I restriction-modification methylase domain-containing protein n=1 Tax=Fibrobacter sp. UBA4297 TaxID=1946536 RepID=UPI0025BF799B|nr:Eco57I restriction-modification methylase domain-containing protein [Fibrobacter sp. UBA4297]
MKKFFAVIGNPPYQDESLGGNDRYAPQIYNTFIDESYQVADMTVLVHPGRFLFNAGSTPKAWNKKMLNDEHFCILDYKNDAREVFPNTSITGGVAISYHSHKKTFTPIEVFSPFQEVNSIRNKVVKSEDFKSLSNIVVSAYSYHFSDKLYEQYPELKGTLSDGHDYDLKSNVFDLLSDVFYDKAVESDMLAIYGRQNNDRCFKFIKKEYIVAPSNVDKYKIFVAGADGAAGTIGKPIPARICGNPVIGEPNVGATESFLSVGSFKSRKEASNALNYLKTKFARFQLGILKATQAITPEKWKYVPLQDFSSKSDIDWTKSVHEIDLQLYKKYGLSKDEKDFIETHVKEMV